MSIPKVAVLATALTVGILAAAVDPLPAQAFPSRAQECTNCHGSGGSVTATPSTTTPAAGAAYTVAIAITATVGGDTGYWIANSDAAGVTGTSVLVGPQSVATTHSAAMTAPAVAGTYYYKVWAAKGTPGTAGASSALYQITVGGPPPTTVPPTTVPPTTDDDGDDGDDGDEGDEGDEGGLAPTSTLGASHLSMYNGFGSTCSACHDGVSQPKAPRISIEDANMKPGIACATCHGPGMDEEESLFVSLMNDPTKAVYTRCSDCHQFDSNGDSDSAADD